MLHNNFFFNSVAYINKYLITLSVCKGQLWAGLSQSQGTHLHVWKSPGWQLIYDGHILHD